MMLRVFAAIFIGVISFSRLACAHDKFDSVALVRQADLVLNQYLSQPDQAMSAARQLLASSIEQQSTYFQGYAYYLLAKSNWSVGNLGSSAEFAFKALRTLEHTSYKPLMGEVLIVMARTLTELRNFKEADQLLAQAEELSVAIGSNTLKAGVYRERSMLQIERKDYRGAIASADVGLAIYEAAGDTLDASVLYGRKAKAYCALGEFDKSTYFNDRSIYLDALVGNKRGLGIQYYQAAVNAYKLEEFDKSNAMLKKSLALVTEIGGLSTLVKIHHLQGLIFAKQHKTDSAVASFRLSGLLKDSLHNKERNSKFEEMKSLYALEQKDNAILELKRYQDWQNLLTIGLSVGIVMLLLLIFVLWRMRSIQARANEALQSRNLAIEQQKEEIQAQAEKLLQLNQLKSKLFSVISHDLRGPIANLHALLSLLTSRAMTAEEFISISHKLKSNLNLTQRTLENLLNWSLSQMDGIKTEAQQFDMRHAIDEVCHLMTEVAERKHLSFDTFDSVATLVSADLNQVQLILRNLVHNAIKFSKQNSIIRVYTSADARHCCISVEDSGIGMTAEEAGLIQDHPHHFTKVGTHEEKGTGLGLLLCKEFVKRNGGLLHIKSMPGKGTTVSFTLPLATPDTTEPPSPGVVSQGKGRSSRTPAAESAHAVQARAL